VASDQQSVSPTQDEGETRSAKDAFAALRFRQPFRPYQQRVLSALAEISADSRLHIVAAPGSGKTVLGIELVRRLGRPALVLSPTTTIRDQWLTRLGDFLPDGASPPHWAGGELDRPGLITAITYQALHARTRATEATDDEDEPGAGPAPGEAETARLAARLVEAGIGVLVLDEAHHLRQEWWKALTRLVKGVPRLVVVAFTATPPYGVTSKEWARYEELCGPIDEEISTPELVRADALCPHQDFVWAVEISGRGVDVLRQRQEARRRLLAELQAEGPFAAAVDAHPWVAAAALLPDAVLDEPELAVALLVHRKARGLELPRPLLHLLGTEESDVPGPSWRWWRLLLAEYLHGESWAPDEARLAHRAVVARGLRDAGISPRSDLATDRPSPVPELASSSAKIEACREVCALERKVRGDSLRQVILTDFIRDEPTRGSDGPPLLGAWPVFQAIAASVEPAWRPHLALLTGRVVILHQDQLPRLRELGGADGMPQAEVLEGLPEGFVRLQAPGNTQVRGITGLITEGAVRVLVGTRALLGEGWDAPAANSLILASYAGSYVLTNQMRGRVIRRDPARPEKVASIWHLAAVAPGLDAGWADFEELARRFEVFVGVGAEQPVLESGLARLALPEPSPAGWSTIVNEAARERIAALPEIRRRWQEAIGAGEVKRVLPGVRVDRPLHMRRVLFAETLRRLLYVAVNAFGAGVTAVMRSIRPEGDLNLSALLVIAFGFGLLLSLPAFLKSAWIALRHLPVDGSVRQIALAVYEALAEARVIQRAPEGEPVRVSEVSPGAFVAALAAGTYRDSVVYSVCLEEVLGRIENPRYLVTRTSGPRWLGGTIDYHAVPERLGAKKETAELFLSAWRRRLGRGDLVYTRSAEGRRTLLRARVRAFSSSFVEFGRRLDRWQ
jgi:superfamily II DNA or RNA helicase